jgi:hypothetical protein
MKLKIKPVKFYLVSKVFRDVITDGKNRGDIVDLFEGSEAVPANKLKNFLLTKFERVLTDDEMKRIKKMRACYLGVAEFGTTEVLSSETCCFFGDTCLRIQELDSTL